MNKASIKYIVLFVCEMLSIWVGVGMPMPVDTRSTVGLLVALCVGGFTAWKNHNISEASQLAQGVLKEFKTTGIDVSEAE